MDIRKNRSAMVWLLLSAAVIAIDQGSKAWVLAHLPEYTPIPVVDGLWNWYRSYNTGAAFSFLSEAGGWQQVFFSMLAMVVSVALGIALKRLPRANWRQAAPYALIIGGALGNAADRIARGHVVDFIQWHWKDYYWPSFNLGDVAIVVGAVGLVLSEGVSARRRRSPGARRAGRRRCERARWCARATREQPRAPTHRDRMAARRRQKRQVRADAAPRWGTPSLTSHLSA